VPSLPSVSPSATPPHPPLLFPLLSLSCPRYTKWGEAYAAKEEKKRTKTSSREMPDPAKIPPGTDPAAWRKYCQETKDYWEKYDRQQAAH
jgi:hypothetical protein